MNKIAVSVALAATLAACGSSDEKSPPVTTKVPVASAPAGDLAVELLTDSRLEVGMTPIYLSVRTANGSAVTDATVSFVPTMTMMGGKSHSAPVMAPAVLGSDGTYRTEVVFQMASGDMGTWSADVGIVRPGQPDVVAHLPSLTIAETGRAKSFANTDPVSAVTTKYILSLNFAQAPNVGLNPVIITLHTMQDMMTFVPVDDASFDLVPEMPSMGHGSPGSVNPILTSPGRYEGQLSFSMMGAWETTITVSRAGAVVGTVTIQTTF